MPRLMLKEPKQKMELNEYEGAAQDFKAAKQIDPSYNGLSQRIHEADREHKKSLRKDYYKILEISKDSTEDEIKKAYRKLALKWHPDKNGESEETMKQAEIKFKDISESYSILSDPTKRKRFDTGADLEEDYGSGYGGGGAGFDPNIIFQTFFGGGGGGDQFGGSRGFGGNGGGGVHFQFSRR